jgi:hypothetical protein
MSARLKLRPTSHNVMLELEPQPCTSCGAHVILARIEPAKPGFDLRTLRMFKVQ